MGWEPFHVYGDEESDPVGGPLPTAETVDDRVLGLSETAIIFRTGEYASEQAALIAASAYTLIILGLAALLLVERRTRGTAEPAG